MQVSDVTGAGDTVLAFLASELSIGQSLDVAITRAMQASIIAVQKFGTEPVLLSELPVNKLPGKSTFHEKLESNKSNAIGWSKNCFHKWLF